MVKTCTTLINKNFLDIPGKVFSPKVNIDGYTLYHMYKESKKTGGVALYVRWRYSINSKIKIDRKTESLWVDIKEGSTT